jgi:NAD(P)-dependent dehydrogenase (short-subunit alcohol dehydrogenase family)
MRTEEKWLLGLGVAGVGAAAAAQAMRSRTPYSFRNRSVVISGARGLALLLARQLAGEGARLTLLARDAAELDRATQDLRSRGADPLAFECDVRHRDSVDEAIRHVVRQHGAIDVLVNNAGTIQAGPVEHMTVADFQESLAVHFWGPLYAILATIPYMRRQGGGRIVNISSIGGKIAVPHLLPYCAGKFALAGLSDGFRAELAKDRIVVTSVYPGLMRTGSHVNAWFKGRRDIEYALFSLSVATPLTSMNADRAARRIIEACRRGDAELIISVQAKLAVLLNAIFPGQVAFLKALVAQLLPGPTDVDGQQPKRGWESRSRVAPSVLTLLPDRASRRNNETVIAERESVGTR